ncbi:uncharacterized protein V6R79_020949 [Siganus canaliculatus]
MDPVQILLPGSHLWKPSSIMADNVYNNTTAPNPKTPTPWFSIPEILGKNRFVVKVLQVLLSLVAFALEEAVSTCLSCGALYFFEFVSCSAFLFTLLLLILLCTPLHLKVGISCWPTLDFFYSAAIALVFLIASIVFAADNGHSTLEGSAVAFGFLASLAFIADVGLFVRTSGVPWRRSGSAAPGNGAAVKAPEEEALANNGQA